jgi:hypothetical protein
VIDQSHTMFLSSTSVGEGYDIEVRKMTHEEDDDIKNLCQLIPKEQDRQKFSELVKRLSERLEAKDREFRSALPAAKNA